MDYSFEHIGFSKEHIRSYSELLSHVFPETKKYTTAFVDWQYNLNPAGKAVGFDAFYDNKLAAHYVALPVEYTYKSEKLKGLLSLNTATHPDHQGKGLFTKLASRTYEHAASRGYRFVIGVANQNSTHGFIRKLGFSLIAPLEVKIGLSVPSFHEPGKEFFQSVWSKELLDWRLRNPSTHYYKSGNSVVSKTHISFINALLSRKKEFNGLHLAAAGSLLKMSIGHQLPKSGLEIPLPDRFKPSPLNLILKPLSHLPDAIGKDSIYFELADFDAY